VASVSIQCECVWVCVFPCLANALSLNVRRDAK
jgi:hypothetical protein